MGGLETRWFELSTRELRVLLAAAAIVLLSLLAVEGIRPASGSLKRKEGHRRNA